MSNTTSLNLVLERAIQDGCCFGWVFKPQKAYFIRRDAVSGSPWLRLERNSHSYQEVPEDFSMAYEITVFSSAIQHKWIQKRNGEGNWGIISDFPSMKTQDLELYLWGKVPTDKSPDLQKLGWTEVFNSRTGSLLVPVRTRSDYITLKQRNYLGEDSFGNTFIKTSRYLGFSSTN